MKEKITVLVIALLIGNAVHARKNQNADSTKQKYCIGTGLTYGGLQDNYGFVSFRGIGGNLEAHYLFGNKFSLGLNFLMTGKNYPGPYQITFFDSAGNVSGGQKYSDQPTRFFNIAAQATYYVWGNNSTTRAGLFLAGGFGYFHYKSSSTNEFYGTTPYGTGTLDFQRVIKGIGFYVCPGIDYKVGPGRLFVDLPFEIALVGTATDDAIESGGINGYSSYSYQRKITPENFFEYQYGFFHTRPTMRVLVNYGYKIYF